jgi:hypothetical protein
MRDDGLLTVEGLIDILRQFNPKRVVIMAQSFEANGFSPLSEVTTASYFPTRSWEGTIGKEELDEADDGTIPCIILDPVI